MIHHDYELINRRELAGHRLNAELQYRQKLRIMETINHIQGADTPEV